MGGSSCKQAPPWVARATIASATSPLPVLSQLRLENVIACIEKYRAQAQTARALDAGSLEDLCDDFVSDCRHFAKNDFRKQLIALYTATPSQASSSTLPAFHASLTGLGGTGDGVTAASAQDVTASPHAGVTWKDDPPLGDAGEEGGAWVQVDCQQVFASLVLLSSGPLEAKVEYLVRLFCWTEQQEIEAHAVYLALVAAVRGMSLLTQNAPPSDLFLAEVLERVDALAKCTENGNPLVYEYARKDKIVTSTQLHSEELCAAADGSGRSSEFVQETLRKCASKVWTLPSVVAALAGDAAVQKYHDVVTKIFPRTEIEEKLSEILQNFRLTLQRVTNPAGFQGAEKADMEHKSSSRKRSFSAGRASALKKKSQAADVLEFDLVPLPWRCIDAILCSCIPKQAVTTRLLDELQFETRTACQDLGIEWKKWLDEPVQESLHTANLSELLPPCRKEMEVSIAPQSPLSGRSENSRREGHPRPSVTATANAPAPPHTARGPSYRSQPSSAASRTLFRPSEAHGAGQSPRKSLQGRPTCVAESGGPTNGTGPQNGGTEGTGEGKESANVRDSPGANAALWKFAFSSGTYMWSDDVQLFVTPLLAFCALDCHGDGVIAARHLDLLFYLLKAVDPVRGGFFSKLEKILAADTRALFGLSVDALDPFSQLKNILSKQRQEIRLLSFAVAISICATIHDRRQHENYLASRFRRFDLEQSGTVSRSDLEVLLVELIKSAVNTEDSGAGYDKALETIVDNTINTLVEPSADRVEFNIYLQAHDRVRKTARKLKAELLELASQFEVGGPVSRQNSRLNRMNSQKSRRSSSMLRASSQSGLRRGSKMRSTSKNAIGEGSLKSLLGRK